MGRILDAGFFGQIVFFIGPLCQDSWYRDRRASHRDCPRGLAPLFLSLFRLVSRSESAGFSLCSYCHSFANLL